MNSSFVSVLVALALAMGFVAAQKVQVDQGEILLSTVPNDTVDASLVRFALISSNRATVRATLGPYQSSQTVYHNRSDAELSAHVVHSIVYRHNPQVRVVFHANQRDFRPLCITLYGQLVDSKKAPLLAKCQPVKENSACMAELIVPADWWPNAWLENGSGSHKSKKSKPHIELTYATSDDLNCQMGGLNSELKSDAAKESSPKHIARIPLSPVHATYEKITMKDSPIEVFLPENPLYPKNVIYAPVFVKQNVRQFVIGANIVGGLHVERLEPVAKHVWKVAIETTGNQKIRITCSRIDDSPPSMGQAEHVFDILFRVDTDPDVLMATEQAIEWVIDEKIQAVSQLNIQKDRVQNILVITRSRDLINTAIITGSQVSQLVKLIMISEAGQMSDVTHKASCHSSDESVLKVSPSCTSIYLDGSESRSSANVSIHVKYSGHMSESYFTVWTPETPFTISVSDEKLSHVKQWHAPPSTPHNWHRNAIPKDECKLRFQQSIVKVYTRFVSINHNSGRENYLLGKRRLVADITDMVHIRSSNSHVASFVAPNVLTGVHPGKADIQVVAPTTGKILATKSLRVTAEKEVITSLNARVVSGLNLAVASDVENNNSNNNNNKESSHSERAIYVAKVSTDEKMTSRYQEAVLDITLRFSDGTEMPLENFNPTEYNITVDTLDPNVVVVAPNQNGNTGAHPRIICVGQGSGDLLSITLETSDLCVKRGGAIQDAAVYVSCMPSNPDNFLYQDAQVPRKYSAAVTFELQPQSHKNPHYPLVNHHLNHLNGGPLQVGLYTLFGVFCMALLAFVASCSVFAVHIKNTRQQNTKDDSQDWVWLSKETLEQAVRPKNISKFPNIVVNPMGDLESSRNLGNFVCSDGFGANICQNGDLARNNNISHSSGNSGVVQQQRQESRIVLPGRARPLPSEPIDVRNNNVPADNNNDHTNLDMNQQINAARNTTAVDSLSFNEIFGSGAEGTDKVSPSTDSGVAQSPGFESPVNEVTVRSNMLAEVEDLGSSRFSAGSPTAAGCAIASRGGNSNSSSPSGSSASRSIIVNPIDELGEDELEPPPVPPRRQPGGNDTLNWRRLERQYNNNREKLAEYLDSLQESIA